MLDRSEPTRLVLASRSPRRAQLLREAGYRFEQLDPPFHDPPQPTLPVDGDVSGFAADLAARKALSCINLVTADAVILAADTLCAAPDEDRLLGQPATREQAREMIQALMGRAHRTVTGLAVLRAGDGQITTAADTARVTLGRLAGTQIETYLDTGQWRGKAGGYNLADRQSAGWPLTVQGDPQTVTGLPMRLVHDLLTSIHQATDKHG